MSETMRIAMEIGFNILYLIGIWWIVVKMFKEQKYVLSKDRKIAAYFKWAFFLLALGDTGHVGFRVLAYALGGLESNLLMFGYEIPLVGIGALSTAYTVTFFYMIIAAVWKEGFNKKIFSAYLGFQLISIIRLVIMLFPQNQWSNVVPPSTWSLYRNIPLMIVGIGIAVHILMSNAKVKDPFFTKAAIAIFVSFVFYIPVILWVQKIPMLGMLMIPKTIAYIVLAILAYRRYYRNY